MIGDFCRRLGDYPRALLPILGSGSQYKSRVLDIDTQWHMTPSTWNLMVTALGRGLRKRCPHCGEGRLFSGWSFLDRCSVCGLVFARNAGDTWAFTIIGDRLPIGAMIVVIYFGVLRSHRVLGLTLLLGFSALAIWTAPNRWGVSIALHYLSRVYWPDPADPIPPPTTGLRP